MKISQPTYLKSKKIQDILVSDLGKFYGEPVIRQPIIPNVMGRKPSDHSPWFVQPHTDSSSNVKRETIARTVRPLTDEVKRKVADWIQSESWVSVYDAQGSSDMATQFHSLVSSKIEDLCPSKTIKMSALNTGKPRFPAVEKLARQKRRLYNLKGNSPK